MKQLYVDVKNTLILLYVKKKKKNKKKHQLVCEQTELLRTNGWCKYSKEVVPSGLAKVRPVMNKNMNEAVA